MHASADHAIVEPGRRAARRAWRLRVRVWRLLEQAALLLCALGLGLALGAGQHGSPDSLTYLNAAEHLARGDGYVISVLDERGNFAPLACFAPLFSALIALRMRLAPSSGPEALSDVVLASFALYALACHTLFRRLLPGRLRATAGVCALAMLLWPGSLLCLRSALSDLLGAGLALFFCASLLQARTPRASLRSGLWLGLGLWARWANLYVAVGALLGVLLAERAQPFALRLRRAATLGGALLFALGPLWLRNLVWTGTLMGPRERVWSDPFVHAQRALEGLAQPLFEVQAALLETPLGALHGALLVLGCVALVVGLVCWRDARADLGWCIVLVSAALLVLSSSRTPYDALSHPRFWLALVPLIWALVLRALAGLAAQPARRLDLGPRLGLALCAALLLLATSRSALALRAMGGRLPARSGLLAQRPQPSPALRRALELADARRCRLAAPQAYWLYPQIGTRAIRWLDASSALGGEPRVAQCVILPRDSLDDSADVTAQRRRLGAAARIDRARLLQRDAQAELWWYAPAPLTLAVETRPSLPR